MIRSTLKKGIKSLLGRSDKPTPDPAFDPPNWQSRPPDYLDRGKAKAEPAATRPAPAPLAEVPPLAEPAPEAAAAVTAPVAAVAAPAPVADAAPAVAEVKDDVVGAASFTSEQVQEILDEMVRPALQGDGGDITLLKVEDDNIYVRLVGACNTCPSSIMTMKMGVEALLKEEFPAMRELIQVDSAVVA